MLPTFSILQFATFTKKPCATYTQTALPSLGLCKLLPSYAQWGHIQLARNQKQTQRQKERQRFRATCRGYWQRPCTATLKSSYSGRSQSVKGPEGKHSNEKHQKPFNTPPHGTLSVYFPPSGYLTLHPCGAHLQLHEKKKVWPGCSHCFLEEKTTNKWKEFQRRCSPPAQLWKSQIDSGPTRSSRGGKDKSPECTCFTGPTVSGNHRYGGDRARWRTKRKLPQRFEGGEKSAEAIGDGKECDWRTEAGGLVAIFIYLFIFFLQVSHLSVTSHSRHWPASCQNLQTKCINTHAPGTRSIPLTASLTS